MKRRKKLLLPGEIDGPSLFAIWVRVLILAALVVTLGVELWWGL